MNQNMKQPPMDKRFIAILKNHALSFFKVMSGELNVGTELINQDNRTTEKFNQLFIMDGKNRNAVNKLSAGDIGATLKLKNTKTNHTLYPKDQNVIIHPIVFPEPRIRVAIFAKNQADDEKMSEVLAE